MADFSTYIEQCENLCEFISVKFDGSNLPDYSKLQVQQLYLLRYAAAYVSEYDALFQSLLVEMRNPPSRNLRVFSIGTGSILDYYGACAYLERNPENQPRLIYYGIDRIKWNYCEIPDSCNEENGGFYHEDVTRCSRLPEPLCNVLIFPKSIGEFSDRDFKTFLEIIENTKFRSEQLNVCASVREQREDSDYKRLGQVVQAIEKSTSLRSIDTLTNSGEESKILVSPVLHKIQQKLGNLSTLCMGRESCTDKESCEGINRNPMASKKYRRYRIIKMSR